MPKKRTPASASTSSTKRDKSQTKFVGNNVRKLRLERRWTQWQLAQVSRLSERTIQRIERGARIGITAELALACAFEVEITELYANTPSGKGAAEPSAARKFQLLKRLVSGADLLDIIQWAAMFGFDCSGVGDERSKAAKDFLDHVNVWKAAGHDVEPDAYGKAQQVFQDLLDELDACGVFVFGGRSNEPCPDGTAIQEGTLIITRADDPRITRPRLLRQLGKAMCLITAPFDR